MSKDLRSAPQQVRLIAGSWKRTPLPILPATGLRPTPSRVRETVFSWLTHLLDDRWETVACLDLFAGSGALGFEAASRGAHRAVLIEQSAAVAQQLDVIRAKLDAAQVTILRGDAIKSAQRLLGQAERFDLIFVDPPYGYGLLPAILPLCAGLLSVDGMVYVEAELALDTEPPPAWMQEWEVIRNSRAGQVFFHLLRRRNSL